MLTLAGAPELVESAALRCGLRALELMDLSAHDGVHPRLGVVDVVPFVPYRSSFSQALAARDRFAHAFAAAGVPCFLYGPERTLPEIRQHAFSDLPSDLGPKEPHPTAGACCVGAREVLVAYNLVIDASPSRAKQVARDIRGDGVRALGLAVGEEAQVSINLVDPDRIGPSRVYDQVATMAPIKRAELVGLVPRRVLEAVPRERRPLLGLSGDQTVEERLSRK